MADYEIIERKPSSPLATALLGVALACLIGAMVFQGIEIHAYKQDNPQQTAVENAKARLSKFEMANRTFEKNVLKEEK